MRLAISQLVREKLDPKLVWVKFHHQTNPSIKYLRVGLLHRKTGGLARNRFEGEIGTISKVDLQAIDHLTASSRTRL